MIATLGTDRLVLRPFRTDDMDALVALQAKESFWWYPLRRGMTDEETADFLPELLPAVEVGWRLGVGHRGKGYATEAAAEALRWGFEDLGLGEIVAIYEPENVASGRVMDRLGFAAGSATVDPKRDLPLLVRTLSADEWRAGSR